MTESSYGFDGPSYTHNNFAAWMSRFRGDGYMYGYLNQLAVTQDTGLNMNVLIDTGGAMLQGFGYANSASVSKTISASDPTLNRIDRIILRLTRTGSPGSISIVVLEGTPASSAAAPDLTQTPGGTWEISLAQVSIPATTTAIVTGLITDERNTAYCGISAAPLGIVNIDVDGHLDMESQPIHKVLDPAADQDADTRLARNTAITASNNTLGHKNPVVAATTGNITIATALNNGDTIDGVTLATDNRVLVKDQTAGAENGIYVVGSTPARAGDFDSSADILGSIVTVIGGTVNKNTRWMCTNTAAITMESTSIVIAQHGDAPTLVVAGTSYRWNGVQDSASLPNASSYTIISATDDGWPMRFWILAPGTIRVSWRVKADGGHTIYSKVYVSGVATGVEKTTTDTSYETLTDDITVVKGDYIDIYYKTDTGGAGDMTTLKIGVASVYQLPYLIPGSP